jgi:hypothetical protein
MVPDMAGIQVLEATRMSTISEIFYSLVGVPTSPYEIGMIYVCGTVILAFGFIAIFEIILTVVKR